MIRNDLDAAEVPDATDADIADFHSLRNTFISNLVAGGVHPNVSQQLARHSSIALTMDRYSHCSNDARERVPRNAKHHAETGCFSWF